MTPGRNAPCTCGSGRKYKRCCAARSTAGIQEDKVNNTITITATGTWTEEGRQFFAAHALAQRFDRFVRHIDDRLREEGVPIPDRPEAAVRAAEKATGTALPNDVPDRDPLPMVYEGEDRVLRIRRWYQERYKGALEPSTRIESESQFLQLIEEIDQKLAERGVPIPGRPIAAGFEFCSLLKEELRGYPLDRKPVSGRYTGDDLLIHMDRWYKDRYGDRLNMDGTEGAVVLLIRGTPWVADLPFIIGSGKGVRFVCEYGRPTTLPSKPKVMRRGDQPPPPADYNVLDAIRDLPDGLAKSLTGAEREEVLNGFLLGRRAHVALGRLKRGQGLVEMARGDLHAAVTHLSEKWVKAGQSKWASLQAAEKILKAYIEEAGGSYKFSHELSDLRTQAEKLGLPRVHTGWTQDIQCPAGVRYGQPAVSVSEAVTAHHASLRMLAHVAEHLRPARPK